MSFGLFSYKPDLAVLLAAGGSGLTLMHELAARVGESAAPNYLLRYIERTSLGLKSGIYVHKPIDISGYGADTDKDSISRKRGFIGNTQIAAAPAGTVHHLFVIHNGEGRARLFYKFVGSIQFIKNTAHDS